MKRNILYNLGWVLARVRELIQGLVFTAILAIAAVGLVILVAGNITSSEVIIGLLIVIIVMLGRRST